MVKNNSGSKMILAEMSGLILEKSSCYLNMIKQGFVSVFCKEIISNKLQTNFDLNVRQ